MNKMKKNNRIKNTRFFNELLSDLIESQQKIQIEKSNFAELLLQHFSKSGTAGFSEFLIKMHEIDCLHDYFEVAYHAYIGFDEGCEILEKVSQQ